MLKATTTVILIKKKSIVNFNHFQISTLKLLKFSMASKRVECTFGSVDVCGENYSGPPKVTSDLMDVDKEVENKEPVVTVGEEQEPVLDIESSKPVSRYTCPSV